MRSAAKHTLPRDARDALVKLGEDIAVARKKRGISTVSMAERAFISRNTLYQAEKGNPSVSIAVYATLLSLLGLVSRLGDVAERSKDEVGLDLDEGNLPERITLKRRT